MEPKYITFEQAKWLKEKGFNEPCDSIYKEDGEFQSYKNVGDIRTHFNNSEPINPKTWHRYDTSAPEQHQVVDWLLEKHGIFVEIFADDYEENHNNWIYLYNITMTRKKGESRIWIDGSPKDSPKEAYSVAFDYIKDNDLI